MADEGKISAFVAGNVTEWPFGPQYVKEGFYSANHTSDISLVYERLTILVPWPWLLCSFTISFLVAGWCYYSTLKQRYEADGESIRSNITILIFLLTTVRSVATFILAIKSFTGPLRYPPVSAVAALAISALSSALDCSLLSGKYYGSIIKRVAQLNAWITFASLVMTFALPFAKGSFVYGRFEVGGGTCPVAVRKCSYQPPIVGCPDDWATMSDKEKGDFWGTLYKDLAGLGFDQTITSPAEVALGIVAMLITVYIAFSGFRLISWFSELFDRAWNYREEAERKRNEASEVNSEELFFVGAVNREKPKAPIRRDASAFTIISIIVLTAVAVPLHAQEETHPKGIHVMDGFGKPDHVKKMSDGPRFREQMAKQYTGENEDGTSWVDCYVVTAPISKTGFMTEWIDLQKKEPLTFLAMI
ncbi:hypothetical protein Dda_3438 [Drechslerella dactyloides]|uniref:Uncharacterized protein n=1 Tax=Drechslerella dactyloides TaxID=74499 RepID=A0AAD6J1Z7_DREDA|nr:hypothetical protein Dda_3438 [Drechslerella dactyloides]